MAGYSISLQKSAFVYTKTKLSNNKVIPFTITSKTVKVKDFYTENYKTQMKEIEDDTNNRWKGMSKCMTRRTDIVKMFILCVHP